VDGCHLTDIEYRWSLGNPPRSVIVKPAPKECMENGILYKGKGKKRYQVEGPTQCQVKYKFNLHTLPVHLPSQNAKQMTSVPGLVLCHLTVVGH
jgi:hypothetical protein